LIASLEDLVQAEWAGPLDRRFAAAIAEIAGERDPLAVLGALVASRYTSAKHVCADLASLAEQPVAGGDGERVGELEWPALTDWLAALERSRLVSAGDAPAPLALVGERLYLYRYWDYERRLAGALANRAADRAPVVDDELLAAELDRQFPAAGVDALQREAVATAVRRRLSVISGGPGTGKTTSVSRIISLLVGQATSAGQDPPRVLLLAPTGKAAARLVESLREARTRLATGDGDGDASPAVFPDAASTIHRALGYRPQRPTSFRHGVDNPLAADVVIVDEASMVDLALMTKLVEAVPRGARLGGAADPARRSRPAGVGGRGLGARRHLQRR
jgi:exodeoxyribonuclease V alpha subunit